MLRLILKYVFFAAIVGGILNTIPLANSYALSPNLVISQVQVGGVGTGTTAEELVVLYNNSPEVVDVTNWCVQYSPFSDGVTFSNVGCLLAPDLSTKLLVSPRTSVVVASQEFLLKLAVPYTPDAIFSGGKVSGDSGHIRIIDAQGSEIDRLGYDNGQTKRALHPEGTAAILNTSNIMQRLGSEIKIDTDNNVLDFEQINSLILPNSGVYEETVPIDVCPNTLETEVQVPVGFIKDSDGDCFEDICINLDGLQKSLPVGYVSQGSNCEPIQLKITELLPNSQGVDTGKEYIEIFNPSNQTIDMSGYYLQVGPSYSKNYPLANIMIEPGGYYSISDIESGITLPNSAASVRLLTPFGAVLDESLSYLDPSEDAPWALIDNSWQYTNQATPGSKNIPSIIEKTNIIQEESEIASLSSCGPGKYRHPETNRCRNVVTAEAAITACKTGQIRSLETNRCRNVATLASTTLAACKPGQQRSAETNRCRNIAKASATSLKPCLPNQERSSETNRCRKKMITPAAGEVKDVEAAQKASHQGWMLAGSAAAIFGGYGIWEWRTELRRFAGGIGGFFVKNPPTD